MDGRTTDTKIIYWGNKIICYGNKITYWGNNTICCGNKIIYWGNKIICCGNKIVCCGNKISFLWEQNNKLLEQNNKLLEQAIILREHNFFSRMALISHRTKSSNQTILYIGYRVHTPTGLTPYGSFLGLDEVHIIYERCSKCNLDNRKKYVHNSFVYTKNCRRKRNRCVCTIMVNFKTISSGWLVHKVIHVDSGHNTT